ncbi:MAG: GMC family oxidoreductase N-terminal domain-containing protein [Novosphingobium sp.]
MEYDYIIVGAGSAGCVLAHRLSADPATRVLVLEAGGSDKHYLVSMPKGIAKLATDPRFTWQYAVEQPRMEGMPANEVWIRGKGLGGSSSINGMIYVRGQPEDYEQWGRLGATGWDWPTMKAAFRAIEDYDLGEDGLTGRGGPLHVSTGTYRYPVADALVAAGEQMGLHRKDGLNREDQEGVGYLSHNIKRGKRQSAATVFLRPAMKRGNVDVVSGAHAERILFEDRKAVGVRVRIDGRSVDYRTRGEVIVSCGAIESPRLLQLSGIGPAARLQGLGIAPVVDSPDVGEKFLEHLAFALPFRMEGKGSINSQFYGLGLVKALARYYLFRDGPMATGPFEVGVFARTRPAAPRPNLQIYLSAFTFARGDDNHPMPSAIEHKPGVTAMCQLMSLTSRGSIRIRSADPADPLQITPNWLSTPEDQRDAIDSVRYMRRYMAQPALAPYRLTEMIPGTDCESDEDILTTYRKLASCGLHGVGTCRMGSDPQAVVDPRARVNGVDGLRVVDCSIMPSLVSGNTNGPTMAMAWHAAGLILEDARTARR